MPDTMPSTPHGLFYLISQEDYEVGTIVIPILQSWGSRDREMKQFAGMLELGRSLAPEPMILSVLICLLCSKRRSTFWVDP